MNIFENTFILKDEAYESGFFPKVPNYKKSDSVFILTDGTNNGIVVNDYTTPKAIRQGKYKRLVEISAQPYAKEISLNSPSRDFTYSFEVYIKAVIQVHNPLIFYANKNIDVETYFTNLFLLDVQKITRGYSVLNFDGMDDKLTAKLSSYNTIDESIGFRYQISSVSAIPGKNAQDFVHKQGTQQLNIELKNHARQLSNFLTNDYEVAIMTEAAEGIITEKEALEKVHKYKSENFDAQIKNLEILREKGFVTDQEAKSLIAPTIESLGTGSKPRELSHQNKDKTAESSLMDSFYSED